MGLIGARGYVGRELLLLVRDHPSLELAFASSRALAGRPVREQVEGLGGDFLESEASVVERGADVFVLALPNGAAGAYVEGINRHAPGALVVDLSADYRFDDGWVYGLSEHNAERIATARRISNPGCYATAMHLALRPIIDLCAAPPHCFGVSGYSGAGTSRSEKNDPAVVTDNILPYAITGHLHEREVTRHLGRPVRFAPSVGGHFRGIVLTALAELREPVGRGDLAARYERAYAGCELVRFEAEGPIDLRGVVERQVARVGALSVDEDDARRVGVVCALDNLLKGAASQAIQNINLALGLAPTEGLA
ncbi:MAG: N-acetyl-gamma-glutamyl-phosphate reductase [Phycisphaerales bacterium JB059]